MTLAVDPVTLLAFIPAALALNLTPGADMMFCVGQGLKSGPRAAVAADLGIALGGMVHVALAGLGLGALVAAHPGLFDLIRWIGVAYLLWLALQALRSGALPVAAPPGSSARAFRAAPMAVIQPVTFLQLVWATLLGWLVFGDSVDGWVMLGGSVILGSVSYITWREARLNRRAVTPAANATKL